ncbi:sensor histidine kinase [Paenibacillus agricola]|uniref:histidine kinase n=1 Tax=Paenibacillus agricola TaxID=2716264 RepID=A0ABX0JGM9_9BACL|nr:ATP-binding protein [Paenibacillus agricola]NHN32996.1 HAMP domain-containing protein [Paenibacillus agricola]
MNKHATLDSASRLNRFPFTWFPFNLLRGLILFVLDLITILKTQVGRSIRLQLMAAFTICLLSAFLFYSLSSAIFGEIKQSPVIDYESGIQRIDNEAQSMAFLLNESSGSFDAKELNPDIVAEHEAQRNSEFAERLKRATENRYKVIITDLTGKVILQGSNAAETNVDIHKLIRSSMDTRREHNLSRRQEASSLYPVTYKGQPSYLVLSGIPEPNISYERGTSPFPLISSIVLFIVLFYFLSQRKMRYIEELASGLLTIATGKLDTRVIERSDDELGSLAKNMNLMAEKLQLKIEEERRAERLKNELVTNVSHDLRTPLTLIMGYLRLLNDKNYETEQQAQTYLSIAYNKSEKLNSLIDDLFIYTKLAHQDIPLNKEGIALNDLLEQLLEEFVTPAEEQQVILSRQLPKEKIFVNIDVDQMIRVFENLLGNALKYSPKPGVIDVSMSRELRSVVVRIRNNADELSQEELEQLFERFFRVDASRSSHTGGSGLGLAIAKSIVEAHDGSIGVEQQDGEIVFFIKLKLA